MLTIQCISSQMFIVVVYSTVFIVAAANCDSTALVIVIAVSGFISINVIKHIQFEFTVIK